MKKQIKLFIVLLFTCALANGQTPSMFLKMSKDDVAFGQNLPAGTLLVDMNTYKRYLVLLPLDGAKTIKNCIKLLFDEKHALLPDGSISSLYLTAEIKEIGTNSSNHYIGEIITTDDPTAAVTADDGLVVSIWSDNGVEKVLLVALVNAAPGFWDGSTDSRGWRLPTIWELTTCFNSTSIINTLLGETNGFLSTSTYWSGSEVFSGSATAYTKDFSLNNTLPKTKTTFSANKHYVRIHQ